MTGDSQDMLVRLRAVLPARWFPDESPVLDAVLAGLSSAWAWCYGLVQYARAQTRIATATDFWLDIVAGDFFGNALLRRSGEDDAPFRGRILGNLFQDRGTRAALVSTLTHLTGRTPVVFEPAHATDTGAYGGASGNVTGLGYGVVGGWGNLQLPFQCFVRAYRAEGSGIAVVAGWGASAGGYGIGAEQYASLSMIQGQVTDTDINQAVASVMPAATIAWLHISS